MLFLDRIGQLGKYAERKWVQGKHPRRTYWCVYTLIFCILFSGIAMGFMILGKSFIFEARMGDGLRQHYVSLAYFGEYLRDFFMNLFVEHRLELPMWDIHIGYGSDILTTLHYYAMGDPLNLLSIFVPAAYTEYLYEFLIVLRMYLAGAAFSTYCLYHKNGRFPTLLGAILFAFSQWMLVAGFKHPFFMNPCIYFPLLLLGIDKIFKKEKPYLFILTVAVSAMSNFYFFYMLGIFMVLYAIYRYLMIFKKLQVKNLFGWLGRFAGFTMVGMLMSAVIFLPSLLAVLGTDRIGAENYIPSAYRTKYYHMLLPALFGKFQYRYTIIGISAVGILGLFLLFSKRRRGTELKAGFVMCIAFLLIPFVAHVFNGFSYVTNRWCWALIMLVSYIFVKMYPEIFALSHKRRLGLLAAMACLTLYIFVDSYADELWNICGAVLAFIVIGVILLGYRYFKEQRALTGMVLLAGICAGTFMNMYFCFTSAGNPDSGIWKFADKGTAYERNTGPVQAALKALPDISRYRYEQGGAGILQNSSMLTGLNGGQFFFSLANGSVSRFRDELYSNMPLEQNFQDINGRAFLMKILSEKYFAGIESYVPYGFKKIGEVPIFLEQEISMEESLEQDSADGDEPEPEISEEAGKNKHIYTVGLYEDSEALPLAYTYDSYIPREVYEKMNVMEKQQALLQGVVLDESSLEVCSVQDTSIERPYTITPLENCELFDNRIKAREDEASCVLEFQGVPKSEVYVAFDNLQYLEVNRRHKYTDEEWKALSFGERRSVRIKDESVENQVGMDIETVIDGKTIQKGIETATNKYNFYNGRHNFMSNMGYANKPVTRIKLTFRKKGSYRYDDLSIYFQPMAQLNTYAKKRKTDKADNLSIKGNDVNCRVNLDRRKVLVFSLPYGKGWRAVVDGQEAELKQANTMFMAVELKAGEHEIELHYTTPYIKWGLALSILGVVLFITIFFKTKNDLIS